MRRAAMFFAASTVFAASALAWSGAASAATPAAAGEVVYTRWCVHCHSSGRGNPGTDSLQVKYGGKVPAVLLERTDLSPEAVSLFVRQGVLSMPLFRKTEITDAELAALSSYVAQKYRKPR